MYGFFKYSTLLRCVMVRARETLRPLMFLLWINYRLLRTIVSAVINIDRSLETKGKLLFLLWSSGLCMCWPVNPITPECRVSKSAANARRMREFINEIQMTRSWGWTKRRALVNDGEWYVGTLNFRVKSDCTLIRTLLNAKWWSQLVTKMFERKFDFLINLNNFTHNHKLFYKIFITWYKVIKTLNKNLKNVPTNIKFTYFGPPHEVAEAEGANYFNRKLSRAFQVQLTTNWFSLRGKLYSLGGCCT